jgi:hypothetical protein
VTSKLTLSIDPAVVAKAKRYAKKRGVSISRIVESYLSSLSTPAEQDEIPPILRSLSGILKRGNAAGYRKHLSSKYR